MKDRNIGPARNENAGMLSGRELRRALNRRGRKNQNLQLAPISAITNMGTILEQESDMQFLQRELKKYQESARKYNLFVQIIVCLDSVGGVQEELLRRMFLGVQPKPTPEEMMYGIDIGKMARFGTQMTSALREIFVKGQIYTPEVDDSDLVKRMQDSGFPVRKIYTEALRGLKVDTDLLKLQISWLKDKAKEEKKKQKKADNSQNRSDHVAADQNSPRENSPEVQTVEPDTQSIESRTLLEPYPLAVWQLYWTNRFWSDNPRHLKEMPNGSLAELSRSIALAGRGVISIKPISIARAVEFFLTQKMQFKEVYRRIMYWMSTEIG